MLRTIIKYEVNDIYLLSSVNYHHLPNGPLLYSDGLDLGVIRSTMLILFACALNGYLHWYIHNFQ